MHEAGNGSEGDGRDMVVIREFDREDERLSPYLSLTNHQLRSVLDPERALTIVESETAIRVALERGVRPQSLLLSERRLEAMRDVLEGLPDEVPVFVMPDDFAQSITGYAVTRGALSAMVRPACPSVEEILGHARRVVVVEGVTDTSNVGAIFRNAAALAADAVVCAPTCADPLSRRAVRVSMGNVFCIPWTRVQGAWPHPFMDSLGSHGFTSMALALEDRSLGLTDERLRDPERMALFLGSEGAGLTRAVIERCDYVVKIPMSAGVDSLNVAATSAVALWELFARQS